ncbi:DevR family CRISPR-associated autoregulator [Leptolyngbya sp. FACHB-711]|uniref:DevR family CRISPR-associated autoregulator n=1 Tax=Leptolyngbya sp. FACHB-711 TaxID=2692813 RepID=UPI001689A993|nr:DevR family CRISPR-associated autoregulator [Leptolyngbya sp. FACHB-711]MBD2027011.1 DevR family CRISPR-associated autoregulator [Leptolyngbya sp. FACHB-711]
MSQTQQFPVYSIAVNGQLSWQLHALNNEGNEGNQSLTRRYYIIDKNNPEPQYVNGVSGDMLKHIQAEHLHRIAIEGGLSLSEGGKRFSPDRVGYDIEAQKETFFTNQESDLTTRTDKVLKLCAMSDLEGFMVTVKGGQTLKRESVIEFGTVVGVPTLVKTQSYFHAKYGEDNPTPYNVQISSGLYAAVLNIEAFRIGYNPHSFGYAIEKAECKKRLDALLKSVLYTFLQPNGAKRNTHLPHPDGFTGVITVSTKRCPAPMVSPLQPDFERQIDSLAQTLNRLNGAETIRLFPFDTLAEFAEQIAVLIDQAQPWESNNAEAGE